MDVTALSNDELVARIKVLNSDSNRLLANQLLLLGEIEARELYRKAGSTSMTAFCITALNLSEGATSRRLVAARAVRRFPSILKRVENGEIHLTALALVASVLTETNVDAIIADIIGKTTREVEHLVACIMPKGDVPTTVQEVEGESAAGAITNVRAKPLSASSFRLQLTLSTEAMGKLDRIVDLTRHQNPSGDYGVVLEQAIDVLLAQVEKKRLAKTVRPSKSTKPAMDRPSRATVREVWSRDEEKCTYVDENGRRCCARGFLELDHIDPASLDGSHEAENLRLLCRAHNQLVAEERFGKDYVERKKAEARRKRAASNGAQKKNAPSEGISEGAANSAAEGGGGGGGNSVTASANPNPSSLPESHPSSEGSAPGLRATKGARAAPASPSRRTGS